MTEPDTLKQATSLQKASKANKGKHGVSRKETDERSSIFSFV